MKALTVKQPWAWLIVNGHKTQEYRTWKTDYRGPLAIIASARSDWDTIVAANDWADDHDVILPDWLEGGGIVGIVELTDITVHPEGGYIWHLQDAKPLSFIACKGRLGLFDLPPEVAQQLLV